MANSWRIYLKIKITPNGGKQNTVAVGTYII